MKNVRIMAVRFLDKAGTGTVADAISAIDYAINNGAHILSNSEAGSFYSQALFDGVKASTQKGLPFIAAAGNERNDNDRWETYPADFALDNIISVGAMTKPVSAPHFQIMEKTLYTSLLQEQVFYLPIRQKVINGSLVPPWRLPLFQGF